MHLHVLATSVYHWKERGPLNAITDVPGVAVGHHTLIPARGSSEWERVLCVRE